MYVDKNLEFSDGQAVTATAISSNVYDTFSMAAGGEASEITPNSRLNIGAGEDVWAVAYMRTAATDAGSDATLVVEVIAADDAALTTNVQVLATSGTLAFASFSAAGSLLLRAKLPNLATRRYVGFRYTVASGPLTAGNVDAFFTIGAVDAQQIFKSGFTVQ